MNLKLATLLILLIVAKPSISYAASCAKVSLVSLLLAPVLISAVGSIATVLVYFILVTLRNGQVEHINITEKIKRSAVGGIVCFANVLGSFSLLFSIVIFTSGTSELVAKIDQAGFWIWGAICGVGIAMTYAYLHKTGYLDWKRLVIGMVVGFSVVYLYIATGAYAQSEQAAYFNCPGPGLDTGAASLGIALLTYGVLGVLLRLVKRTHSA